MLFGYVYWFGAVYLLCSMANCAAWQIDGRISMGCVILGESVNGYVFSLLM